MPRECSVVGCGRPFLARGLCNAHYKHWQKWGDPLYQKPVAMRYQSCSVEDCPRLAVSEFMCGMHLQRVKRWGDPSVRSKPGRNTEADFWANVMKGPACWLWRGTITPEGYGRIKYLGRNRVVHRMAYELLIGPIPEGLELDHLCRNRWCCNPDHLEAVTHAENVRRGDLKFVSSRRFGAPM